MIDSVSWILAAGEFLVWGTFLSLLTRRVLNAVFLTPLFVLSVAAVASYGDEHLWTIRMTMMGFLFLASIGLSRRWLKRETLGWSIPWSISLRRKHADYLAVVETAAPEKRLFKRLKWQARRQARTNCFTFLVIGVPLVAVSYWTKLALQVDFAAILIALLPLLCGVCVFRGEQEGKRFRYLTECGVTPHTVWLSKQRVWITATLSLVALFVLTDLIASSFHPGYLSINYDVLRSYEVPLHQINRDIVSRSILPVFIVYCFATYSIGQFVSMLFSRGVTAAFVGLVFSCLFVAWLYLMLWLKVPLLFSVWPIPIVLLGATRVHSSDWMLERGGFKPWLRLGTTIIVPGVLIVSGMIYYRSVMELAGTFGANYGANLNRRVEQSRRVLGNALTSSTAEERNTADIYRRASELLINITSEVNIQDPTDTKNRIPSPKLGWDYATPSAKKWLEDNQESLALILEATQRESCAFLNPATATYGQSIGIFKSVDLSRLLLFSARKLESENKLDKAFKRYIASLRLGRHVAQRGGPVKWNTGRFIQSQTFNWIPLWAGHPQQTTQRVKEAINQFRAESDAFGSSVEAIAIEYGILRRTFLDEPDVLLENISTFNDQLKDIFFVFLRFCPWERTRSVQLLELLAVDELNYFRKLQIALDRRGIDMVKWRLQNPASSSGRVRWSHWNLLPTTPLLDRYLSSRQSSMGWSLINSKTHREATLLMLGLIAYRKEHGELPLRLDQLVGEYFDELPLDPWSGEEFGYRPNGYPTDVDFSNHVAEAGQPLLWSTTHYGAKVIQSGETEDGLPRFLVVRSGSDRMQGRFGRVFPIPE